MGPVPIATLPLLLLAAQDPVDFETEIRPVLEESCVGCHGPRRQKAGLRLDLRDAALAGSAFGERAVIVPGSSATSELFRRIASTDEDERMPVDEDPLPAATVERFRAWIDAGARWPEEPAGTGASTGVEVAKHWAYVAPMPAPTPALPALSPELAAWSRGPLDAFVAARLAAAGLAPSPEADRATLARRAALDLTGLPPTPAEVEAFVHDERPDAWEREIERLLASPHYAEHQARSWLDLARYADSQGYEKDDRRTMWRYRDWVIDAFARDLPFDRFTIEQLAGDLLPDPTTEQLVATGFHRNTMVNKEGGTDPEEFRVAAVVDRVDTTASVWLGSTIACARCHDHKFDPFRQEEYYELYAFFDDTVDSGDSDEPTIEAPTAAISAERERLLGEIAAAEARYDGWTAELDAALAGWIEERAERPTVWTPLRPDVTSTTEGTRLGVLDDDSVLAFGELPSTDAYTLEGPVSAQGPLTGLRLEVLTDPSLPDGGPGRPEHRNFVLSGISVQSIGGGPPLSIPVASATADYAQEDYAATGIVDGDATTGWAIAGGTGESHEVWIRFAEPLVATSPRRLGLTLFQDHGGGHLIGRFRVSTTSSPLDTSGPVPPRAVAAALDERPGRSPTPEEEEALRTWFRSWTPLLADVRAELAALRAALPEVPTALVMRALPQPRTTHVLERGSFLSPGAPVEPGVPAVLHDLEVRGERPDRLDLARWLVAPENPLTARVLVNRLWQRLFGAGLVATENDFGLQGDAPTHPELLDWLACELARTWSVKELHRTILRSATYRQSARATPRQLELDPGNRWLGRASRLRVDAETVRDLALAVGGLLDRTIGGPSVFPPQPEGTWAMTYSADRWETSSGSDRWRRGLYTFWRRTAPYPTFQLFDAPSRELTCSRRVRTNTPLQALATLNDPVFVEAAVALARRMLVAGADDDARVEHGFRACVARRPSAGERARVLELLAEERAVFAADPERAALLVEALVAERGEPAEDAAELAAWTVVANVLLNLDETLTRG
jgi:hypothetical protein